MFYTLTQQKTLKIIFKTIFPPLDTINLNNNPRQERIWRKFVDFKALKKISSNNIVMIYKSFRNEKSN